MDQKLTQEIQNWLAMPADKRTIADLQHGALLVLRLSNNQILYNNLVRNPQQRAADIEYQLKKYAQFRLANLTHEQVVTMQAQVNTIVKRDRLDTPTNTPAEKRAATLEFKKGKRADHDSLPKEIQALYVENLSLLQKMRNLHTKLTLLSTEQHTCSDSERYPFLKELIALDKTYHANWKQYDTFGRDGE